MSVSSSPLIRTLGEAPDILEGIKQGLMQVWGGVVRYAQGTGKGGQIVAHLKFPSGTQEVRESLGALQATLEGGIKATQAGFDAVQGSLNVLQGLQVANVALSGLNLAVSAAGFAVVCNKLNAVSEKLDHQSAQLDLLVQHALDAKKRDSFRDWAGFHALTQTAAQFCETNDTEHLKPLLMPLREQYLYTRTILLEEAQAGKSIFEDQEPIHALQDRLQYLGMFLAHTQSRIGAPNHAELAMRGLKDDIQKLNALRVKALTADPGQAFYIMADRATQMVTFLERGKNACFALSYQADLFAIAHERPEAGEFLEAESDQILLLAA